MTRPVRDTQDISQAATSSGPVPEARCREMPRGAKREQAEWSAERGGRVVHSRRQATTVVGYCDAAEPRADFYDSVTNAACAYISPY